MVMIVMKKRSITSNYLYNLIYQLLILLIPLITIPYLTRVLGATELGIYSYTYSIATIFFLTSALGINTYGQREIAYVQQDKLKVTKIFWELVIIRSFATIGSLIILYGFSFLTSRYSLYYQIFGLYVFGNLFDITWFYQGIEDFKAVAIRNIIVKVFYLISIFVFIKTRNDLWKYILLFSLSTLVTNVSFWLNIKKLVNIPSLSSLNIKKHLKPVLLLFVPQIASLLYTVLDKTMIGIIVPDIRQVNYYEQASYIDKTVLILITTIGTVMASRMATAFSKKDTTLMREYMFEIVNFVWLLGSALMFGVAAVIKNVVPWFYGPEYYDVINLVYIMSPLIIIIGFNNVLGVQYLVPTKKQNKYIFAIVCGSVLNIVLNLILLNVIGTIGAAISSVIAEFVILMIELSYVKNIITFKDLVKIGLKYLIFGLVMFVIVYYSGFLFMPTIYGTILQVVIGFIIYACLLLITKDSFINKHVLPFLKNRRF